MKGMLLFLLQRETHLQSFEFPVCKMIGDDVARQVFSFCALI